MGPDEDVNRIESIKRWDDCTETEQLLFVFMLARRQMIANGWDLPESFLRRLTELADQVRQP
jgi:hypothetical protein